jgi:hypothetical protein
MGAERRSRESGPAPAVPKADSFAAVAALASVDPSVRELLLRLARAAVDSPGTEDHDLGFPRLSDTRIADEPDGASTKGKPM